LHSLVNLSDSAETAAEVHCRLACACRRFLGLDIVEAGFVPLDPQVAASAGAGRPLVSEYPACPASRELDALANRLLKTETRIFQGIRTIDSTHSNLPVDLKAH
jgi:flagellar biosynthesis protein FlhG